jgi:hyperosmotically inducible periplasmic protein
MDTKEAQMRSPSLRSSSFTLLAAVLLGTSGCSDNGSADKVGQKIDKGTETVKEKLAQSSDAAERKLDQAGASIDDAALAAEIKAKILRDPGLKAGEINVDTHNGVVVLTGTVNTPEEVIRAVRLAQSVDEVKYVENRLSVRNG